MIVVIDDDEAVRQATELLLRTYGWDARTYPSGEPFLADLAEGFEPSCVVLDIDLPNMSGAEVMEQLFKNNVDIPVILLTNDTGSPLVARTIKAGAVGVVGKTAAAAQLIDRIQAVNFETKHGTEIEDVQG